MGERQRQRRRPRPQRRRLLRRQPNSAPQPSAPPCPTHRDVLRPSMSSMEVREPFCSAAAVWLSGPPPCSSDSDDCAPKSPWARA